MSQTLDNNKRIVKNTLLLYLLYRSFYEAMYIARMLK